MGTNYYVRLNECDSCGRYDEAHLGKSLRSVQAYPEGIPGARDVKITRFDDWRRFLLDGPRRYTVWDEYGDQIEDVAAWLAEWKPRPGAQLYGHGDYIDPDGFVCISAEFS